jgi:hypothetical protein
MIQKLKRVTMDSIITKNEVMKNVNRMVFDNAWDKLRYFLDNKLKGQDINLVNTKVSNQLSDQIRYQLWLQVVDQVKESIKL